VTTIEGLAQDGEVHRLQAAFIRHDGFQCGYCTPGKIMSAVALIEEDPSVAYLPGGTTQLDLILKAGARPRSTRTCSGETARGDLVSRSHG
jgi:aerobic-type carbon monoxide dehydrogenase small subunit (CoxS/CutS family)